MSSDEKNIVLCDNLVKLYKTRDIEVVALQGLDLTVTRGEMMALIGNSGSGKSTLMNILGGLDKPSAGSAMVDGIDLSTLTGEKLRRYQMTTVGFVWQNTARNLIPYLTALENVEIPMSFLKKKDPAYAKWLLDFVGLKERMNQKLFELSGGEQQRVAMAIALANKPKLLLADEPTGAMDTKTTAVLLELLKKISREMGVTIVIVTHDRQVSSFVDRVVAISDGRTSSEFIRRRYDIELQDLENTLDPEIGETHDEYAVIDRAGRVQIPANFTEAMGIHGKNRVKITYEGDAVVIRPSEDISEKDKDDT